MLQDRTVLITGASAGIGEACAAVLAAEGARLILAARRRDRLGALADELQQRHGAAVHVVELDVRRRESVNESIESLPAEWAAIDLLVNNAGLSRGLDPLHEGAPRDWEEMIDTNLKGLLWVDRAVVPGMVRRGAGHVIHIGSIAGRQVYPGGNVYCATKHAVRALTDGLRLDLAGTAVRVTSIDPGLVNTEFSTVRFRGDRKRADSVYRGMTPLTADDVAQAVLFAATRPAHVTVADLLLLPTDQASANLVYRRG
ncbi:MAG: SDR family NAD(P)-dependent oxidoreductase [Acidobacteria bacterium]|nr:SDR family NAD(P)-dependent oxidoreductase [Acidobacteriota bacterium]NIM62565.1 SDR family NAD(P)-dependent oxidoreductase [Acidobacteriota bacterium]NIO58298.1 SDR family NAD(P)-dependent oxidoreductase [Acidobacteriota bacterium]NIQ29354.1 SDR family NAD(P)-dependent oxidoreductase [Acidobacteriota bacterium]NIQ83954.1 SDR family NAD(P)-dependent oxidoreductase [Acidobacteriota bacterium]